MEKIIKPKKTAVKTVKKERPVKVAKEPVVKALRPALEIEPEIEIDADAEDMNIEFDEKDEKKNKRYFEAVGRRKTAIARVRLLTIKPFEGEEGKITVNGQLYKKYFTVLESQQIAEASLKKLKSLNRFEVVAKIKGGGIRAQAEALRHGLARCLILFNLDFRKKLKKSGYLKRDPRAKERKKYGLRKARRAPQWSKR